MLFYVGFDDTDILGADRGTGKLARMFGDSLPGGYRLRGVIRHQLPRIEGIPFTSHNSSACAIIDAYGGHHSGPLAELAARHIERHFLEGSDPGLCVAPENSPRSPDLISFGFACSRGIVTQDDARRAAGREHLSGHGGTNDGIIGAAAGVGLTMRGWSGRYIEFGRLRDVPPIVTVEALEGMGIMVVGVDNDTVTPCPGDTVDTGGWLRPRLWARHPVLPVESAGEGVWRIVRGKKW